MPVIAMDDVTPGFCGRQAAALLDATEPWLTAILASRSSPLRNAF
jgi:hypothetical protein